MKTVLSHADLLRELSTVELGLCWALEYHESKAKMNAAAHATWKVDFPPIVKELHDAKTAAIILRQQLEQVRDFSERVQAAYDDLKAPRTKWFCPADAAQTPGGKNRL